LLKNQDLEINRAVSDLLRLFSSKIAEHVTYVLTGILAFFAALQVIIKIDPPNPWFPTTLSVFVVGEVYLLIRTLMWTKYASIVIRGPRLIHPKPKMMREGLHHTLFNKTAEQFKKENPIICQISSIEIKRRIALLVFVLAATILVTYYLKLFVSLIESHFFEIVITAFVASGLLFLGLSLKSDC